MPLLVMKGQISHKTPVNFVLVLAISFNIVYIKPPGISASTASIAGLEVNRP